MSPIEPPNNGLSRNIITRYIVIDNETANEIKLHFSCRVLGSLSSINVFVGKNNSGKSRLLRKLFSVEVSNTKFVQGKYSHFYVEDLLNWFQQFFRNYFSPNDNLLYSKLQSTIIHDLTSNLPDVIEFYSDIYFKSETDNKRYKEFNNLFLVDSLLTSRFKDYYSDFINLFANVGTNTAPRRIYLPILRGLRPINQNVNRFDNVDVYSERTRKDYFRSGRDELKIFTGLSMYEDVKKLLLGDENERKLIADFEIFLCKNVFEEKITLIPKYNSDVLEIKIGDRYQFPIYNLGDGLQTIITILFPIFIVRNGKHFVFIEEPETHLHPHWQVKLLNALKDIPNQQYFITTHSTVFINDKDSSIFDISEQEQELRVQKVEFDHQKLSILRELGYKQSDLLQANYILWVEGPSDKIYLEYCIKQMAPELNEGDDYTILLFGGGNYKHVFTKNSIVSLDLVKSINRNFGIILDSDKCNANDKLTKNKAEIQECFKSEDLFCWVTNKREIENYLDLDLFVNSVKEQAKKTKILIQEGDYIDRNKVVDLSSSKNFKSKIIIPEELMKVVQKNKDGTTKNIDDKTLREGIERAIQETSKTIFEINKIEVAKFYVSKNPIVPDGELKIKLESLIEKIKQANHMNF